MTQKCIWKIFNDPNATSIDHVKGWVNNPICQIKKIVQKVYRKLCLTLPLQSFRLLPHQLSQFVML